MLRGIRPFVTIPCSKAVARASAVRLAGERILVDATVRTVATNLGEGALLVILVLFVLLGNFRAALITALVIPVAMLMTAAGMLQGRISANLMSLGALDFGLIVDGAVIIAENALRHLAERQASSGRVLSLSERLETVHSAAEEMIDPTVYGQAIIILVYVPLLTFSGIEGKMFEPMALTVILALVAAFVLSLTFVPALIAIFITGRVGEGDNAIVRRLKTSYAPLLRFTIKRPLPVMAGAAIMFAAALLLFVRLGQVFIPTLDEKTSPCTRCAFQAPAWRNRRPCKSRSKRPSVLCRRSPSFFQRPARPRLQRTRCRRMPPIPSLSSSHRSNGLIQASPRRP
jgi:Cu/Ag efflux pump CusA